VGPQLDPLSSFRLDGRVAVVTGASSGLGERFARVLDSAGASVVITARRAEQLDALAGDLAHPLAVPCDLTDDGAPAALVDAAIAEFGSVDIVVNNAGIDHNEPALDESLDDFRREVDINLVAPFELARCAARTMIDSGRGGSIVNIASIWGMVGVGQIPDAGYAASKGGLVNMTRELASQWARKGVRVNVIAPAFFPTEMTQERMFEDERSMKWLRQRTPMGRAGEAHELDGALLFLASDASSYLTGVVLPVDGGWTAI
jgi:NAD(P)-dependent dehydrogenase (short-subunit alcohol dehydrogenase family)